MPLQDLRCPVCEVTTENVYYRMSEGFPGCPDCGAARRVDWSHGLAPAVHGHGPGSFTPIDMGVLGKAETKEAYDRAVSVIQQRFPGHRIELEGESKAKKQERVDALRQRSYETKKRAGVTESELRQRAAETEAEKAGKATKIMSKAPVSP